MAELGYARKYRPTTVSGYIGNDKLKKSAMSLLRDGHRPQVVMLEGASGCGKTTFARLLAKEYLCENRSDTTGACGCCPSCLAVDDYITTGSTDMLESIKEVDIASESGKKDIDPILDEMMLPSFAGEWKVYILDECHMATPQAQNRMLKIVEEPPENLLIIFCTTNPEEMIKTLLNRCQIKLHVKKPTVSELAGLLKFVCTTEGVDSDPKGLRFIASRSELTIREALSSLERVITEKDSAKYDDAIEVFEEISDVQIMNFYKKLIGTPVYGKNNMVIRDAYGNAEYRRDVLGYVTLLHEVKTSTDLTLFVKSVMDFTKKGIYIVNQITLDGVSDGELAMYRELFGNFTVEQMSCLLTKLTELLKGDVETNLLLLGYTGIIDKSANTGTGIPTSPTELRMEEKTEGSSRERIYRERAAKGAERIEDLAETVDFDDIQNIFGGASVN